MKERGIQHAYISRIQALRNKHAILNQRIEEVQNRPSTTDFYLRQLKKQKLFIKEEIEGIRKAS